MSGQEQGRQRSSQAGRRRGTAAAKLGCFSASSAVGRKESPVVRVFSLGATGQLGCARCWPGGAEPPPAAAQQGGALRAAA